MKRLKSVKIAALILGFFSCFVTMAQGEFSSRFIGDRFAVYNGRVNYKLWSLAEFFYANPDSFSLSIKEKLLLRASQKISFPKHYLLEEEYLWVEYSMSKYSFTASSNKFLVPDVADLLLALSKNLSNPMISFYQDHDFVEPFFVDQIDSSALITDSIIWMKEAWYYDKVNNILNKEIVGLGISLKSTVVWVFFPKVKNMFRLSHPNSSLFKSLRNQGVERDSCFLLEKNPESSDFRILVLEALQNSPRSRILRSAGKHKFLCGNEFKESLLFNYEDQVLSGSYFWYYGNNQLKEQGFFKDGIRSGQVHAYYKNGQVRFIKNYREGFMNGKQQEFDEQGVLKQEYHFENKILNGSSMLRSTSWLAAGNFKNGLCHDQWKHRVVLPAYWKIILRRNTAYFDEHYEFEDLWESSILLNDSLFFTAQHRYSIGNKCLNNKCLTVVLDHIK